MNSPNETPAATGAAATAPTGANTYSTGGGGVTFAHRVAATYLASMLTGGRRTETNELPVRSLAFQTGPAHPVDDLLVVAGDHDVELAIACRATPHFVRSDKQTVKLVKSLLDEVAAHPNGHVAVAVAGWKAEWTQVAKLCDFARQNNNAHAFHAAIEIEGRWSRDDRRRHTHLRQMIAAVLDKSPAGAEVLELTWRLLTRLRILGFRLQSPDETDWTAVATSLDGMAAATTDGVGLRDRLAVKAGHYDAMGAVVDLNLLRRDTHLLLEAPSTRTRQAWDVLNQHRAVAFGTVRSTLGANSDGAAPLALPFTERRAELAAELRRVASERGALVVTGSSGTGKSALVLSTITDLETTESGAFETVVVNFRELPNTSVELQHMLGASIGDVMAEVSAPGRVLVVDAADAAVERSAGLLRDLFAAASKAGLGVVAVTADPAAEFVREQLSIGRHQSTKTFDVEPLDDDELAQVAQRFPLLRGLLRNLPATSLLRRLVVLDLLSRTGLELDDPMSEWDCLELIWSKVVRGDGRPTHGSPQAREEALLALAAAALAGPDTPLALASLDPSAVDALRADHLLAPHNTYRWHPQFAHDEVRRYATAIHLVRSGHIVDTLQAAGVPRWALSAVTLACKGRLVDPARQPEQTFRDLVSGFQSVASAHGSRWADVPIEAVLETPAAYECIKTAVDTGTVDLQLPDVLRIVQQRFSFAGLIDPALGTPVARYLIDQEEPWNVSKQAFEVLTNWLQALVLANEPAGHELREALRARLLTFWARFPRKEATEDVLPDWVTGRRRRRRVLDYKVTDDEFVETLALLGPDINTDIETCLRALAEDAPAFLAPAADAPLSARSIAQHDPELLATLMEAYYIDEDADDNWGHHDEGIRGHERRRTGFGPPFAAYYFGGFWQLFNTAHLATSIRVLNNVLNHAARIRVETTSRLSRSRDVLEEPTREPGGEADMGNSSSGITLNITGEPREYVGDDHVWTWYRGTSVGPYPCMSALQAMERVAEKLLNTGASPNLIAEYLLHGCENLATPGMLYGLFARNIEKAGNQLDRFLAEPAVWFLEFSRTTNEHYGFRASSEGLAHPERRQWTPREVSVWLMTHANEERRAELRSIGEELVAKGVRQGLEPDRTLNWAANLDESRYQLTQDGDDLYLEVVPPPEIIAAQAEIAAQQEQVQTVLRLQNRYWGSAKFQDGYEPPTVVEIADDLAAAHALLDAERHHMHMRPHDAVAHVARTAIERTVNGEPEALGDEGAFAVEFVMTVAATFLDSEDLRDEGQYFDLGADRAIARALPALLTPALAPALSEAHVTTADVAKVGLALAGKAPLETRLFLARGCDALWASPCAGANCIHKTALAWVTESARGAEIGPWDVEAQSSPRVRIEGNLTARLRELDGESIDIGVLDPAIRALGVAATTNHCVTNDAKQLLADLLAVQRSAMVRHEDKGWTADHQGTHTLVAARALLKSYAADGNPSPILEHLDVLRSDAGLLVNILHGLAAAGAENDVLAEAARSVWPELLTHALTYADDEPNVYHEQTWGSWAAAALLPDPLPWTQGMYNELSGPPIDWVAPAQLTDLVDQWLPVGRGETRCVEALIRLVRKLPIGEQATRGPSWIADLCIQGDRVSVDQSWSSNDWLTEIRAAAEEHGTLPQWQALVDALVVAGNSGLAPFST